MITTFVNIMKALHTDILFTATDTTIFKMTFYIFNIWFLIYETYPLKLCVYTFSRIFDGEVFAILAIS